MHKEHAYGFIRSMHTDAQDVNNEVTCMPLCRGMMRASSSLSSFVRRRHSSSSRRICAQRQC